MGAVVAVPLGPWVEFRRKRPVMVAMDLVRCAALLSVPAAFALGLLSFAQLVVVAVVVGAADIAFRAASGACLKALVAPEDLLAANGRLRVDDVDGDRARTAARRRRDRAARAGDDRRGRCRQLPALGAGIRSIRGADPRPARAEARRLRPGDLLDGWRHILGHPALRPLFFNTVLVNGLILATAPLVAVLMLGQLGFEPWQYGLAFGAPCVGGLVGSRLSPRLVERFGRDAVMRTAGTLRACWSIGLAFVRPGALGLALVLVVQLGLVTCVGVFNPVFATFRLEQTPSDRVARTLSAWSVTSSLTVAALTALWGMLAAAGPRAAIGAAGVLMLATPLLLLGGRHASSSTLRGRTVPWTGWRAPSTDQRLAHGHGRRARARGTAIPGAGAFIGRLRERGLPFLVLTNNSIYTRRDLAARLAASGLEVPEDAIWTSALATAGSSRSSVRAARRSSIGEAGLTTALHEAGYTLTEREPDYVVLGETRTYSFERITRAIRLIVDGARFIATNPDPTGPSPDGPIPATGSVAALISRATGVDPYYVGKPNPLMMRSALNALDAHSETAVMVGDRMDTDIVAGLEAGLQAVLVLTGVTARGEIERYPYRPSRIVDSIADLVDELG